ncbi:hypothetical protein HaLaN_19279 [Haematococcus lacustris]|uniref:MADS-box domain-containing protein n=1 Tax=Haematococcus lacustris TaxID=44745 RepID=A0A699ZUD2_HAELA|nr:hypothetical protein HaLaN_19279 [Haematococcus lacustris]
MLVKLEPGDETLHSTFVIDEARQKLVSDAAHMCIASGCEVAIFILGKDGSLLQFTSAADPAKQVARLLRSTPQEVIKLCDVVPGQGPVELSLPDSANPYDNQDQGQVRAPASHSPPGTEQLPCFDNPSLACSPHDC